MQVRLEAKGTGLGLSEDCQQEMMELKEVGAVCGKNRWDGDMGEGERERERRWRNKGEMCRDRQRENKCAENRRVCRRQTEAESQINRGRERNPSRQKSEQNWQEMWGQGCRTLGSPH